MVKIDYKECSNACELLYSVVKNTVIEFYGDSSLVDSCSKANYIYRQPLENALKAGMCSKKLFIAAFQIALYFFEREDFCDFEKVLMKELRTALNVSGNRINRHEHDKHCHNDNLIVFKKRNATV